MTERVTLACRGVWKLFGARAAEALQAPGDGPDDERLAELGVVAAVRDASLQVEKGEIFVIMGLSGCGKSTLVRCMSRLIEPSAGSIHFDGSDLLDMSEAELIALRRKKIGMVFQNFALLPHLTVLQNVAFPLDVQGIDRRTREARATEMIELVGLDGRADYFPRQLSGGQQQRVGIARSLVGEPELWFLDEPFSALDPLIRQEMQDEFLRLQSMLHKSIVFITHDFNEAVRLADRIAVMRDGRIVQTATPEELVIAPATEYVAEFTRHIPRDKVLRLRSIMRPAREGEEVAGELDGTLTVAAAAGRIAEADRPFLVLLDGAVAGVVSATEVARTVAARAEGPRGAA